MTTHEALVEARGLLGIEENWGQGSFCASGKRCLAGALIRVTTGVDAVSDNYLSWFLTPGLAELQEVAGLSDPELVTDFNDSHTHAEVLALLDRAIAATAPEPDVSFLTDVPEPIPA